MPGLIVGEPVGSTTGAFELYLLFPLTAEQQTIALVQRTVLLAGLALVLLVLVIALLVTRQVVRPVRVAAQTADLLAGGDLSKRISVRGTDDIARLGDAFNEMADSLQRQIRRLEDVSRLQRRFTSDVSHELRTPLTTIRMASEFLHASRAEFPGELSRASELLQDELDLSAADAPAAVTMGVLVYTIALVLSGYIAGKISDRTGRRKLLVGGSTLLFGIGTVLLLHVSTLTGFYVVEATLGVAYGIYVGVDLALVVDVLPNPDDAGKDLGVFNMANALPQTVAPVFGAALLAVASQNNQNYELLLYTAGAMALVGALVIVPIKSVR